MKYQLFISGRAQAVETTSCNQTKYDLKCAGLDTSREQRAGLLDQLGNL